MKKSIRFKLNGEMRSIDVDPSEILLDVLRYKMGATSPKCGCGSGDCGTCTIIINGESIKSCLVLGIEVDGAEVLTLEGIMDDGLTKVQETMLSGNAFQCGFCAPGFIMASHDLITHNPKPSVDEIKEALAGNLCRCTGYIPILEAVHKACNSLEKSDE